MLVSLLNVSATHFPLGEGVRGIDCSLLIYFFVLDLNKILFKLHFVLKLYKLISIYNFLQSPTPHRQVGRKGFIKKSTVLFA